MTTPDLSLIPTDTLTAELARRYPHGCFAGVVDWEVGVEQQRGEVWGNPLVVLGLLAVLQEETLESMADSRLPSGGESA